MTPRIPERRAGWTPTLAADPALTKELIDHLEEEKVRHKLHDTTASLSDARMAGMERELSGITKVIGTVSGIKAAGGIIITLLGAIVGLFIWVLLDKNTDVYSEFRDIHVEIKEIQKTQVDLSIQNAKTLAAVETLVKESAQIAAEVRDQLRDTTVVVTKAAKTVEKVQEKVTADKTRQAVVDHKLDKLEREKQSKSPVPMKPSVPVRPPTPF